MIKKLLCVVLALTIVLSLFGGFNVIGASASKGYGLVVKYDDMEVYDSGAEFTWSKPDSLYDYHAYGNYCKTPVASDEVAYSGNKSIKFYKRCDAGCSFKMINLFELVFPFLLFRMSSLLSPLTMAAKLLKKKPQL